MHRGWKTVVEYLAALWCDFPEIYFVLFDASYTTAGRCKSLYVFISLLHLRVDAGYPSQAVKPLEPRSAYPPLPDQAQSRADACWGQVWFCFNGASHT
jgi:hypothetical protein